MAYFHDDGNDYNQLLISFSPQLTYTLLGILLRATPTSITSWHDIAAVYRLHLLQDPQASSLLAGPPNASRYPPPSPSLASVAYHNHHRQIRTLPQKDKEPVFGRGQHLNSIYTLD